jgi:hypothetical protein
MTVGVGAAYRFDNGIALRAEWDRYQIEAFDGDIDADLLSLALLYSF